MRYPPYREYKQSGVEWLGEIPAHWEITRSDHVTQSVRKTVDPQSLGEEVFHYSIPVIEETGDGRVEPTQEIDSSKLLICGGELLVSKLNPRKGRVLLTEDHITPTVCSSEFVVLNPFAGFAKYLLYVYSSENVRQMLSSQVRSATRSHQRVTPELIEKMELPLPPDSEQRAIAAFLDREIAKLDALAGKFERLLELLEERRAALISHAVTKGATHLRRAVEDRLPATENAPLKDDLPSEVRCTSVEMQDSGIEWLGEIPAHWEVVQVRHVAESLQTGPFGSQLHSSEYVKNGIPVINPSHMEDGCIAPDWEVTVDKETWERLERHRLMTGDIVFARRGELGRCALITDEEDGWLCGTGSLRMRPRSGLVDSPFLNRVFSTRGIAEWLMLQSVGSTMDNLNTSILARLSIPVPPLPEQQAIVTYLDRETARIDALADRVHAALDRLAKYRTALISAAVTGKIDVRGGKVQRTSQGGVEG